MLEQSQSVAEHVAAALRNACHFIIGSLPYILLVFLGHTVTSINHHYRDWSWPVYLVSCTSTLLLGIVLFCVVAATGIPQMIGYACAVLLGRNTRDSLDLMSEDLVVWVRERMRRT